MAEEVVELSSKTKEKIGKSALSRLDQQLMDFKANSDGGSSEGPRCSAGITPTPRVADISEMQKVRSNETSEKNLLNRNASKSSTDYHTVNQIISPTAASNTI